MELHNLPRIIDSSKRAGRPQCYPNLIYNHTVSEPPIALLDKEMDELPGPMDIAKVHVQNAVGSYFFGFATRQLEDQRPRSWTTAALIGHFLLLLFVAYYTRDRIRLWVGLAMDIVVGIWAVRIGLSPL